MEQRTTKVISRILVRESFLYSIISQLVLRELPIETLDVNSQQLRRSQDTALQQNKLPYGKREMNRTQRQQSGSDTMNWN